MTDMMERTTLPSLQVPYVQWGPVIAGAVAAAALALVLHTFAGAIGLAVSSTAPTWRDASIALWVLSGLYLVLVALATYGLGGYLAGRIRAGFSSADPEETESLRDPPPQGPPIKSGNSPVPGCIVFAASFDVQAATPSRLIA